MPKHYYIVEIRNYALVDHLRQQIQSLNDQLKDLRQQHQNLTLKYGAEVQYNNALCDLLKQNGIQFRRIFEHEYRFRNKDS